MPVYYRAYTSGTGSNTRMWINATSATMPTTTTITNSNWIIAAPWATSAATTSVTAPPWSVVWFDEAENDTWVTTPVRPIISRPYIARRSRAQAAEDELRYYYEQEQRRQQNDIRRRHDQVARDRSRELLLAHLTPAQRETFEQNKWFIVEGGLSKQRYRIRDTGHMVANIDVLYGKITNDALPEVVLHRLCGHCDLNEVPLYDQLLAQKMMLELDEERFLKLANRHRVVA